MAKHFQAEVGCKVMCIQAGTICCCRSTFKQQMQSVVRGTAVLQHGISRTKAVTSIALVFTFKAVSVQHSSHSKSELARFVSSVMH